MKYNVAMSMRSKGVVDKVKSPEKLTAIRDIGGFAESVDSSDLTNKYTF